MHDALLTYYTHNGQVMVEKLTNVTSASMKKSQLQSLDQNLTMFAVTAVTIKNKTFVVLTGGINMRYHSNCTYM